MTKVILFLIALLSLESCNSSSLSFKNKKLICKPDPQFADAGFNLTLTSNLKAVLTNITFAGAQEVFNDTVEINKNSKSIINDSKGLEIIFIDKNKLEIKKLNFQTVTDDFRYLFCNHSINEMFI